MSLASEVRKAVDGSCITNRIRERSCRLKEERISIDSVNLDLNKPLSPAEPNVSHCDYIFLGRISDDNREWIAPIELKSGKIEAGEAGRQLQGGADVAHRIVPKETEFVFKAIAAANKFPPKIRQDLRKSENKVVFRGVSYVIETVSCGSSLFDALKA